MKALQAIRIFTLLGATTALFSSHASAQLIDFSASPYTPGTFSSLASGGNADFTGQGNWSQSTGNDPGAIVTAAASGAFPGGDALESSTGGSYVGALQTAAGFSNFTFDVKAGSSTDTIAVGGWFDANVDGEFQSTEAEIQFGINPGGFFYQSAFNGANAFNSPSGSVALGDWYQLTISLDDADQIFTMDAFDLTTGDTVTLDSPDLSNAWVDDLSAGSDYGDPSAQYQGLSVQVTGDGALDLIAIPEPGTWATVLCGIGMLAGLKFRRRS